MYLFYTSELKCFMYIKILNNIHRVKHLLIFLFIYIFFIYKFNIGFIY